MRPSPSIRSFLLLVPVLAASACADSEAASLDTGLPRDEPANQVSPAEARQACGRYEELANEALGADVQTRLACTITGIVAEVTGGGSCEAAAAQCVSNPPAPPQAIDFACENATTFAPSACTATIGELEDCVTSVTRAIESFTSKVDCSLVENLDQVGALTDDLATITDPATNEACAGLSEECLGLLGWTEDAAPTLPGDP